VLQAIDLEDAFIDPEAMLGFTGPGQKPWDLRDRFRKAAVDANPTFIVREEWDNSWAEVLTGACLHESKKKEGGSGEEGAGKGSGRWARMRASRASARLPFFRALS
jgi:hypothetical protein